MIVPVFVDSNVLLYAVDESNRSKQAAAQEWLSVLWSRRLGRISFQVLGEFYVNAIRVNAAAREEARAEVRDLLAWRPLVTDMPVLELGWKYQDRYHLSYWDSLIVAAAKSSSCGYLLTEDLQSGQKLDGVEVVSPFTTSPTALL